MKVFQNMALFFLIVVIFFLMAVMFENRGGITDIMAEDPEKADARYIGSNVSKRDRTSPADRISEEDIHVLDDKVIIEIMNPEWARFTGTKSMDPVFDDTANTIQIIPESLSEIYEGDIVSYDSEYSEGIVIHRVVHIGYDNEGWFARFKGDNNLILDPGKIRFEQIRRVTVGIIY